MPINSASNAVMAANEDGLHENHASFVDRFNARQAQNRAAKQKPTLSVEEHAAHRAQLGNVRFIKPRYSDQTEINVSGIFKKWKRYATATTLPSPWLSSVSRLLLTLFCTDIAPRWKSAIGKRRLNTSTAERPKTSCCTFASGTRSHHGAAVMSTFASFSSFTPP
jgi:hypothetical protein